MKVLAVDSSGLVASVAIAEDDILLAEYTIQYKKTHSQTLLPMLEEVKNMIELDLSTIDVIATSMGPGSFTGLRIGAATVKGLGLALDKPIAEIPTLEGMAYNLCGSTTLVCPMMDARRNQVYTGLYRFVQEETSFRMETLQEQCAVDVREILQICNDLGLSVTFLGDGVPVYAEQIAEYCKVPYTFAPVNMNRQRAASIAALGIQYALEGKVVSAAAHEPQYLRKSQAEREREEANGSTNS